MEWYVFSGCSNLTSLIVHSKKIGIRWFAELPNLKEVVIGDEVTDIGAHAFVGCEGLTNITIGNSVTTIGV